MNKLIAIALFMIGTTVLAQEKSERGRRGHMHDMTPEQVATLQTKKMTLALDLSEAQQKQMQALNLENAKARKAKMEERKAAKEDGERKKPTSEERFSMQNKRLDARLAQKEKMKEILSDEQMEKWEKIQSAKRKHHGKKGKRGRKK